MLRFGLLGCGRISKKYIDLFQNNRVVGGTLCAVADINSGRREIASSTMGVPGFASLEEMLQAVEVDVVCILTPSGLHAEHSCQAAQSGKHVVVEKPMALTLADADRMISTCKENHVKLFVVKQNRFNPPVMATRKALEEGRFGRLCLGTARVRWCRTQKYYDQDSWRGTWELDGGVLANQASHHIDLLEWFFGDVESVFAYAKTALVDIEAEDIAVATLKFKNGALGVIEATTATRPVDLEGSVSILGDKGSVVIGGFAVNLLNTWNFVEGRENDEEILSSSSYFPDNVYGHGHKAYLDHVVECIKEDKPGLVEGHEGRRSLELIVALYESIDTAREVKISEISNQCKLGRKALAK